MAAICVDIFGDMLLTAPLESHPVSIALISHVAFSDHL